MELDEIDALRASVEMLRGTNDRMIDEVMVRTGVRLDEVPKPAARRQQGTASPSWKPHGPRHIDEALADDGEVAGRGFVIPGDLPPSSTY